MKVFDLFSRRIREERGDFPDTYKYDDIPTELRVQIVHILQDGLGDEEDYHNRFGSHDSQSIYDGISKALRREYGVFHLTGEKYRQDNSFLELYSESLKTRDLTG